MGQSFSVISRQRHAGGSIRKASPDSAAWIRVVGAAGRGIPFSPPSWGWELRGFQPMCSQKTPDFFIFSYFPPSQESAILPPRLSSDSVWDVVSCSVHSLCPKVALATVPKMLPKNILYFSPALTWIGQYPLPSPSPQM